MNEENDFAVIHLAPPGLFGHMRMVVDTSRSDWKVTFEVEHKDAAGGLRWRRTNGFRENGAVTPIIQSNALQALIRRTVWDHDTLTKIKNILNAPQREYDKTMREIEDVMRDGLWDIG